MLFSCRCLAHEVLMEQLAILGGHTCCVSLSVSCNCRNVSGWHASVGTRQVVHSTNANHKMSNPFQTRQPHDKYELLVVDPETGEWHYRYCTKYLQCHNGELHLQRKSPSGMISTAKHAAPIMVIVRVLHLK